MKELPAVQTKHFRLSAGLGPAAAAAVVAAAAAGHPWLWPVQLWPCHPQVLPWLCRCCARP